MKFLFTLLFFLFIGDCTAQSEKEEFLTKQTKNVLDYTGTPSSSKDRSSLAYSDQGAWFAYGFPEKEEDGIGFTGPFLMTQENGVWSSDILSKLILKNKKGDDLSLGKAIITQNAYPSHLVQIHQFTDLKITQRLFFSSSNTALIQIEIENTSKKKICLKPFIQGQFFDSTMFIDYNEFYDLRFQSPKSKATGYINVHDIHTLGYANDKNNYAVQLETRSISPGKNIEFFISHTVLLPEYDLEKERAVLKKVMDHHSDSLQARIKEKEDELFDILSKHNLSFTDDKYLDLSTKAYLTLQNNWRVPSGELKHAGLFPSYHYEWFHGFWAWDSWKHATALAIFNPELAKNQIRAMYDFQEDSGFIPDCVYRDTLIEKHNYRNTKAPLSAWAVWYSQNGSFDRDYLAEMYPQLVKQHNWWYENRDHDGDGLCEYGSTDGTLIAAKWESGMDNAVRFDNSEILKNNAGAYSLNQESVDLNAYLAAEKYYLSQIANNIFHDDTKKYKAEFDKLKLKIQEQFFDEETGWFYDTNLQGTEFIKVMGCEGWIPLWANVASPEQALAVKNNMMDTAKFNVTVPLQTLSADEPKFNPENGYWRGPNWLDQSYFGIKGLRNYAFHDEAMSTAKKLIANSEGLLEKGPSIRENYHPITGKGLEAHNFSWSAAHLLLLMIGY